MPNYQKGKIYCLRSHQTDDIYIGSTTHKLSARKVGHKASYKSYLNGKYCYVSSFELCQYDDVYIELIEDYPCENKAQLVKREGYWMREMKCVNKRIEGRSVKEYREENKEQRSKQAKKYYEANKQIINEKKKKYYDDNKEKFSEYMKKYRKENKETLCEKKKKYYDANKEEISERQKKYRETVGKQKVHCECGSVVNRKSLPQHKRTKKHIDWASNNEEE